MLDFRMLQKILSSTNNSSKPSLVVSSQQSSTVGSHNRLSRVLQQTRKFFGRKNNVLFFIEDNICPIISFYNLWIDICPRCIRAGIHMGNKAYHGSILTTIRRQSSHDIAMVVKFHIHKSQGLKFLRQMLGQYHLPWSARTNLIIILIRLGVKTDIILEPFD